MAKSKKVNKWDAAPESIRKLKELIDKQRLSISLGECEDLIGLDALEKVLCDYNELEAKHQLDCGLISEYEEENKNLKSKLDIMTDENDCLIARVFKQDEEYTELEKENEDFRTTLALYERDANMARNLCHSIAFNMVEFHKGEVKKEEENCKGLNKIITRKNAEMCNLKWERDETEKKIKILIDELKKQYDINVTFYQKPGIDMRGLKNFGVHVDREENRKAFNDLKEALDKYKAKNEKLEEKHEKATRYISRLLEGLNNACVAWDESEERVAKLISALDRCHMDAKWDHENGKWCIYVRPSNTEVTDVSFDICVFVKVYDALKKENNNLKQTLLNILEKLEMKVGLCRVHLLDSYEDRANLIAVEHDKLLIKYVKLKKENDELKVENNNLTTDNRRLNDAVESWHKENKKLKDMVKSLRRTVRILDEEGYF